MSIGGPEPKAYEGTSVLEQMRACVNYNRDLSECVRRHAGDATRVIDFGAGQGLFAQALRQQRIEPTCVESDPALAVDLRRQNFEVHSDIDAIADASVDFVYSLNVLEHIDNDQAALCSFARVLRPGGRLYLYVPAFALLYSSFDKRVGHLRRYRRAGLVAKVNTAALRVEVCRYADSLGFGAALAYRLLGSRKGEVNERALRFYDRFVFPFSKRLDAVTGGVFGKNLSLFATKI